MTGRDLIMYILQNELEDEQIFKDGKLLGFMNPSEAADKFDVGVSTINTWISFDIIPYVKIGDLTFIPGNTKDPRNTRQKDHH